MYDVSKMGARLSELRRESKMTQEEFANKLGITPQAVSKWENGMAFPDITMLPKVAEVYGVSLDELFGNEKEQPEIPKIPIEYKYPQKCGGLNLIKGINDAALYADVDVLEIKEYNVEFVDGSEADLGSYEVINRGKGNIRFEYFDPSTFRSSSGARSYEGGFDNIDSIEVVISGSAKTSVMKSKDEKTIVKASGSTAFIDNLKVLNENGTLSVKVEPQFNLFSGTSNSGDKNKIEIYAGFDVGKSVYYKVSGSGQLESDVDFEESEIKISGSGSVDAKRLGDTMVTISGSGGIKMTECGPLETHISGSGSLETNIINDDVSCSVSGSGSIKLGKGESPVFDLSISGSGSCDASKVTVEDADIRISGAGNVTIGRVTGETREKLSRGAKLKVLSRG